MRSRSPAHAAWGWTASPAAILVLWALLAALLAARNPSGILHAEFWGEDGWVWFPGAYNAGLRRSLAAPVTGYIQTAPRLVALVVQPFPLAWAPTLFAGVALAMQAFPPAYLVSARLHQAWPHPLARLLFALIWIALPNTREVYANLTNLQWHLATLALLVLLSAPPRRWPGRAFDTAVLVLSGLSGPFCLLLLPIALWQIARQPSRASIVLLTATVQGWTLLHTAGDRSSAPLGATPELLARIIAQQVVLAPFIGQSAMEALQAWPPWQSPAMPITIALAACALAAATLWRGSALLRATCFLGGIVLTTGLLSPQVVNTGEQWPYMTRPGIGQRYDYLPMLAWVGVLFSLALARPRAAQAAGTALLLLLPVGIYNDWTIPPLQPTDFPALARAFTALPPGSRMAFPINPLMDSFPMVLERR